MLKVGNVDAANKTFTRLLTTRADPLSKTAQEVARTWLTRVDRERVKSALKLVYRQEIEYPESLAAVKSLPSEQQPPLSDRWGRAWSYSLVGFKKLKGLRGQKYELHSTMLGRDSDLADALAIPYGSQITLQPTRIGRSRRGSTTVQFLVEPASAPGKKDTASSTRKGREVYMSVGNKSDGVSFAYLGSRILVLSDGNHWMVLPRPR